ncbi:MAG: shikimate kinase [Thermoplasmata archaeon]
MHGVGHSTGAITMLNALFTGTGSAAGIGLKVRAKIELKTVPSKREESIRFGSRSDSLIAREAIKQSVRFFAPRDFFQASVSIASEIPVGRGLKSSSAVSTAIDRAIASALGKEITAAEVARRSADLTQRIGQSATGAFDDALAGLVSGIVVTNNATRQIVRVDSIDPNWVALLWIPSEAHPPSPELHGEFRRHASSAGAAVEHATSGKYAEAMAENSALVEQILGYNYRALRETLVASGAIASGVSGMGPTLASIVPRATASDLAELLPTQGGERRIVPFVQPSRWEEAPA